MSVFVLGGFQTDFAVNWHKQGHGFDALFAAAVEGVFTETGVDPADVEVIHVGNAFGELFTGQGHLGAMPATVAPALSEVPSARHEGACASGSLAILAAMADLESGRYDCALVVGAELEKTVPGELGAKHMGAAAWVGHEAQDTNFVWPRAFSDLADEYDKRYGLDDAHLRAIGALNIRNAHANPLAQTRNRSYTAASFSADDDANPVVEGRLRRQDCTQLTDGAAAVILTTKWRPGAACIAGWGHRTVGLPLERKLAASVDDEYVLPHVRRTVQDALGRAGCADITDVDGVEVHDCFTMSEYMAIDHLGITPPGASWQAIESGVLERDGRLPVNPGGGLIGGGHPVGATGVRMLLDAAKQVTGRAGDYQVDGARRFATLNIGGSTTTVASFVVETSEG